MSFSVAAVVCAAMVTSGEPHPKGVAEWTLVAAPSSLLNGRLTAQLPSDAKVEARQASIMAAPESEEEETRVVMEHGGDKIVLLLDETFASAPDGLRKQVDSVVSRSQDPKSLIVEEFSTSDKTLTVVSVRHPSPLANDDTVRVIAFYVLHPDGLIQLLTFFATPKTAKDLPACVAFARRVVGTLTVGPRFLDRKGGVHPLHTPWPGQLWKIHLPPDYVVTRQDGPDFLVQRIRKIAPLSSNAPMLGLYTGMHPGFHHRRADAEDRVKSSVGVLHGQPTTWYRWDVDPPKSTRVMWETQSELVGQGSRKLMIHLWLEADSPSTIEELQTMAASMVLTPPIAAVDAHVP